MTFLSMFDLIASLVTTALAMALVFMLIHPHVAALLGDAAAAEADTHVDPALAGDPVEVPIG